MTAIVKFKPTRRAADWALTHSQYRPYQQRVTRVSAACGQSEKHRDHRL